MKLASGVLLLVIACLLPVCQGQQAVSRTTSAVLPPIDVFFSLKGGRTEVVVKKIQAAKTRRLRLRTSPSLKGSQVRRD